MKKRNGNFEYFKPQNGGSFAVSESESENSNDSDSKKMFSLPKRKVVRPRKLNTRNTRKCCRVCLATSVPLLLALLIVGICSSMVYILLGINGMKREVELLKVRLKQVESTDHSNLKESANLQSSFKKQLLKMKKDEDKVAQLEKKLKILFEKIHALNRTMTRLAKSLHRKHSINSLVKDVDQLQKGMADTDVKIERIEDDGGQVKKNIAILMKVVKKVKGQLLNITEEISKIGHVASPSPTSHSLPNKKSKEATKKVSIILQQILNGYENKLLNKTRSIAKVLRDHEVRLEEADQRISETENKTAKHHKQLQLLKKISVLLTAEVKLYRNASQGKLHHILKVLLTDLSQNGFNMTEYLLSIKASVPTDIQKLIDNYANSIERRNKITPTSSVPITSSKKVNTKPPLGGGGGNASLVNTTAVFTVPSKNVSNTSSLLPRQASTESPKLNKTKLPQRNSSEHSSKDSLKILTESIRKGPSSPAPPVNDTETEVHKELDDKPSEKLRNLKNTQTIEKRESEGPDEQDEEIARAVPPEDASDETGNNENVEEPPVSDDGLQPISRERSHRKRESRRHELGLREADRRETRRRQQDYEDSITDHRGTTDQGGDRAGITEQSDLYENTNPSDREELEQIGPGEGAGGSDVENYEEAEHDLDRLDNSEAF